MSTTENNIPLLQEVIEDYQNGILDMTQKARKCYMSEKEKDVTTELVKMRKKGEIKAEIVPLAHWTEKDIDMALETGADRVLISVNGNPWTQKNSFGIEPDDAVKKITDTVAYAKKHGLYTIAQIYDTYRTPLDFMERMHKKVVYEGGADSIALSDTFSFTLPWTATWMVRKVKSWVPHTRIEHHGHNDFGLSTALMAAAVVGGADVVHTSINGIGERVGNACTEEVAMVLQMLLGVDAGINLEQIYPTCELVAELTKSPIPPNKAITGENVFLMGSGMIVWHHLHLQKTDRPWYHLPYPPEAIGKEGLEIILGVGCGKGIVEHKLEKLGMKATKEQMDKIANRVKAEAYMRKWTVPDVQFKEIVREVLEEN